MRILLVTANPVDTAGGVERFCRMLMDVCKEKGWKVDVLTPAHIAGHLVSVNALKELYWTYRLGHLIKQPGKSYDYDVVISNGVWGAWVPSTVPHINVYHGTWVGNYTSKERLTVKQQVGKAIRAWLEKRSGKFAVNVAVSESTKREIERYYKLKVDAVIENAVDIKGFSPPPYEKKPQLKQDLGVPPDKPIFLYVGRMEYGKGIDRFNELASRINDGTSVRASFVVLTPQVVPRYYQTSIHYIIGDNPEKIRLTYQAADALLFPSRYEGYECVTIEALASGLPVLGTAVGAMAMLKQRDEMLGEYILDSYDHEAMHALIERYLDLSEDKRQALSERARCYAEKWANMERFKEAWTKLIREVAGRE